MPRLSRPAPALAASATPLSVLPGVGPAVAEKLAARGLANLQDLWLHLPRGYEDRTALTAIRDCDLLYVGKDEARSLPRIAELLGDAPVLTVTDAPQPQPAAVVIVPDGRRLAFEVDVERSRRAGLKPSAALLGLARNLRRPLN